MNNLIIPTRTVEHSFRTKIEKKYEKSTTKPCRVSPGGFYDESHKLRKDDFGGAF